MAWSPRTPSCRKPDPVSTISHSSQIRPPSTREEGLVDLDAPTGWRNPEERPGVHAGHEHTARDDSRSVDDIDHMVT